MSTSYLGLNPATSDKFTVSAAFLGWGWFYAYCVLSSRTPKQWYGLDHNGNPRQDLSKYAEAAVREGKLQRKQLEQIQRLEAASANAIDGFTLFATSGESVLLKRAASNGDFRISAWHKCKTKCWATARLGLSLAIRSLRAPASKIY